MNSILSSSEALRELSYDFGVPTPLSGGDFYSLGGKIFLKNPPLLNLFLKKISPLERDCKIDEGLVFINGLFIRSGMLTSSKHSLDMGIYNIDIGSRFGDLEIPGYIRTFSKDDAFDIIRKIGGRELWTLGKYSKRDGLKIKAYSKAL